MTLPDRKTAFSWLMLTVAGIVNAFGITIFLTPVHLFDSGISGTAMLADALTPERYVLSFFLILLNLPLFLYGYRKQGRDFTLRSIYAVAVYALSAWIITKNHIDMTTGSPMAGQDLLLCSVFGGIISGVGSGLAMRFGGAMDGIEVMAVIFAKRIGITVGTFVMVYNVLLYLVCGIVLKSWILPLYSILTYMAALKTVDFIVDGLDRAKCAMIVTTRPEEVIEVLSREFETGSTRVEATGGYSGSPKTIVYFVVNRFQVTRMKSLVQAIDPLAYITISEIADVFKANMNEVRANADKEMLDGDRS